MKPKIFLLFAALTLVSCGAAKGAQSQKALTSKTGDYQSEALPPSLQDALGLKRIKAHIGKTEEAGWTQVYHAGISTIVENQCVYFSAEQFTSISYDIIAAETAFLRLNECIFLAKYSFLVPYEYVPNLEEGNKEFKLKLRQIENESEVVYFSSYQTVHDTSGPFEEIVFHYEDAN
ncbi:MAG: hypothetical protein J6O18_07500 [Bacilli bacterium]|nr:hypothetical protein [Bacilli bacterium]